MRIFTQMKLLCNELKKEICQLNNDLISINIIPTSSTTNLNELDPSFMYFQLLKENLLTIKYNHDTEIQQFADYSRSFFKKDGEEGATIIADFLACNMYERGCVERGCTLK